MNDNERKKIIRQNFIEFTDANTLCYSNFEMFQCDGDLFELRYRFDIIESTLWVCNHCLNNMRYEKDTNLELVF